MAARGRALLSFALATGCASPGAGDDERGETETETGASESGTSESESESSGSESSESGASESDSGASESSESDASESGSSETGEAPLERVLFVGNSYTFVNDLPGMFAAMTAEAGEPRHVDTIAIGGATVADHVANPTLATTLDAGWDLVVIQSQSYEAIVAFDEYAAAMVEFDALVEAHSPGARLLVFETWARAPGDPLLDQLGMTPAQMQAALSEAYAAAALQVGAELAPVGQAWALAQVEAPAIELHSPDLSHPSVAGSFLACAVFFGHIVEQPAGASAYVPEGLADADADLLEGVADQLVMP